MRDHSELDADFDLDTMCACFGVEIVFLVEFFEITTSTKDKV